MDDEDDNESKSVERRYLNKANVQQPTNQFGRNSNGQPLPNQNKAALSLQDRNANPDVSPRFLTQQPE